MLDKEDFAEWKKLDVTRVFLGSIVDRINEGATRLSFVAGENPSQDRFVAGMLHAYREILDMQLDDIEGV